MKELLEEYRQTAANLQLRISQLRLALKEGYTPDHFSIQRRIELLKTEYREVMVTVLWLTRYLNWRKQHES